MPPWRSRWSHALEHVCCRSVTVVAQGYVGQVFMSMGLVMEKAGPAVMMRYLDIVCAFIWQATLEHQPIRNWSIVGAVLVTACALANPLKMWRASYLTRKQAAAVANLNSVPSPTAESGDDVPLRSTGVGTVEMQSVTSLSKAGQSSQGNWSPSSSSGVDTPPVRGK